MVFQYLLAAVDAVAKKRRLDPTPAKLDELLHLLERWRAHRATRAHMPPCTFAAAQVTHINHVSSSSARNSTAKNPALDAYRRRRVHDPCAPTGGAYELDQGTLRGAPGQ